MMSLLRHPNLVEKVFWILSTSTGKRTLNIMTKWCHSLVFRSCHFKMKRTFVQGEVNLNKRTVGRDIKSCTTSSRFEWSTKNASHHTSRGSITSNELYNFYWQKCRVDGIHCADQDSYSQQGAANECSKIPISEMQA